MSRLPADDALFERFLDRFVDRLAAELAERVEQRLDQRAAQHTEGPQALDVKQAAARLGVSDRTMHELVVRGQVPSVKVGRRRVIAASTIDRMLAEGVPSVSDGIRRRNSDVHRMPLSRAQ